MKKTIALIVALMVVPVAAQAILVNETCLDNVSIRIHYNYTECVADACTSQNFTQIQECSNNCTNDRCIGIDKEGDVAGMWITYATGSLFLILGTALGIPYGKFVKKEDMTFDWDTTMVIRYVFFFIGFYLMYLSLGMATRISSFYSGDTNIVGALSTSTTVITLTMLVFLFIFVLETLFFIIRIMGEEGERKFRMRET